MPRLAQPLIHTSAVFISYAQNFEDVMLWRALGHVESGFYIDIGAQDPVVDSVSLGFYEQGWRGVHVEPTPAYAQKLRDSRSDEVVVQAAVGDGSALIPFFEIPNTGISTGDADIATRHEEAGFAPKCINVPCIRLSALLDNYQDRAIHWMKIDVEGMELNVLRSWVPSQVRPWVVVLESTLPLSRELSHGAWEEIILGLGYRFAYFDGLNRFYISDAHSDLLEAFSAPPNVFDAFTLSGIASNEFCDKLNSALTEARAQVGQLLHRQEELNGRLLDAGQDDDSRADMVGLKRRVAEQAVYAKQREQELFGQLLELQDKAQQEREALALAHRTHLEFLERAHREHASSLQESLLARSKREQELSDQLSAGIETARVLAVSQSEDRARRVEAEIALDAVQRQTEILAASKVTLEKEFAEREARSQLEMNESRTRGERVQFELERRLRSSTESADALRREFAQICDRHERQVSVYLYELELSNFQISKLASSLASALDTPAKERRHRRFISVSSHPIVVALLKAQGNLNQVRELIMDAPLFTRTNYQPLFVVNTEGNYRLDEFLMMHDRSFVQAAYRAILRRDPDAAGEAYYLQQVRAGESKAKVLDQILRSDEAQKTRTVIHGLNAHLLLTRLCEAPFLGRFISAALFLASVNVHLRDLRVLENHVIRVAEEAQAIHESNMHKLRSLVK